MTSTNNNNNKNQVDTTDMEFGSFNEEEDQFINKKQLVHIEDDTSINVDVSEDDRSKSSSLKKSFLINNISAFNEQFPVNNQLTNKKNENYNENDLNDITNSADFYNSQNGLENIPETIEEKNKNDNINNDDVIQSLETKIDNNGFFFSRKNQENIENNINNNLNNIISSKKINIKNNNNENLSIKDIDDEDLDEEEDNENNNLKNNNNNIRTSQMVLKKKLTPNEIINKYINNQNIRNYNEEFLQNSNININSNGSKYPNLNSNDFNNDIWQQENFNFSIINTQAKLSGSVNTSEQTFGLIQSHEYQNKYAQLEAKYNSLITQNKKLEENYNELKNSNKSVLDLLTYWQKFYLEILEIVRPKNINKNNDNSISDYMDDPYRIQVINDVKKIILIARDKAYNVLYISPSNHFSIKGKEQTLENQKIKEINSINKNNLLTLNKIISIFFEGNKKNQVIYEGNDHDINSLPPIKHIEKINAGINTDNNSENITKPIIKEVIKEIEVPIQIKKFDELKLSISSKVHNISYIKKNIKNIDLNNKQNNSNKTKFNILKINSNIKIYFKGIPPKPQKKLRKNIMHKIAIVQTDMTYKNINSIEALNKACSSQLLNSQKEKEKIQKLYEEKIASLNNYINENIKQAKKEKEKINKNDKEKEEKEKEREEIIPNLNTSFIFLPEMIPPENTYKIFMHCVKHFKYEEEIYKKYLEEEDLFTLKAFVEKMEKYLIDASLPFEKNKKVKKKDKRKEMKEIKKKDSYTINNDFDNIDEEIKLEKKLKGNNVIHSVKQKFTNTKLKLSNNSENKIKNDENKKHNIYNNNNTFNKYKAAIMALKDY